MEGKMNFHIIAEYYLGDIDAIYYETEGTVSLMLVPVTMRDKISETKFCLTESLVQAHVDGDEWTAPYSQGISMRNTETSIQLHFDSQTVEQNGQEKTIVTTLTDERGRKAVHYLSYDQRHFLKSRTTFINTGAEDLDLMMLSSFSITGITPFCDGQARNSLILHRFRSYWSAEGKLVSEPAEQLLLVPSWSSWGTRCEKFYQTGSMPVRKFFPFCGVEDVSSNVTWAAQLEWAGSWQMEPYRSNDVMSLSGGLADFDTGRWSVHLKYGEQFTSIPSYITVTEGGIDDACDRLLEAQKVDYSKQPASEQHLPILYNEYCSTWGKPTHEKIRKQMEALQGLGVEYFVIDAGWYAEGNWNSKHGDWEVNRLAFPDGIDKTAKMLREAGYTPGIWFEWERAGKNSRLIQDKKEYFITRNRRIIKTASGVFLDLRKPEVVEYLNQKVIRFLKQNGFGYLKTDYNESLGAEIDGDLSSGGENLRHSICSVQDFFRSTRKEIPDLIIENCASGGHRLEPSMMKLTSMSSFSDAHECNEIPVVAANLHRLIQPSQSQIWVVLRRGDDKRRLIYSLAAGFLGRMCLSGEIAEMDETQMKTVKEAITLYKKCVPIIRDGQSRIIRSSAGNYDRPEGWQAVIRCSQDNSAAMIVIHNFTTADEGSLSVSHPGLKGKSIQGCLSQTGAEISLDDDCLAIKMNGDFSAMVVFLEQINR